MNIGKTQTDTSGIEIDTSKAADLLAKKDENKPKRKATGAAAAAQAAKAARLAAENTPQEAPKEQQAKEWKPAISQFGEDH